MNFLVKHNLVLILVFSFLLRLLAIMIFRDLKVDNEWGILLDNLETSGILSVHSIQGTPVPNIFMPPLYPFFLYSIKIFFRDIDTFLWVIQFTQLFLSLITIYLTHKILLQFFSKNISTIGTLIFALFPINVYSVSQISSIILQVFLFNIFLYSYLKLLKNINNKYIILFSLSSALLMLLRGEYFIFVILSLIYLYFKKKQLPKY